MAKIVIRSIFFIIGAALGFYLLPSIYNLLPFQVPGILDNIVAYFIIFGLIFFFVGVLVEDYILNGLAKIEEFLQSLNLAYLVFGLVGMTIGLILAWLINLSLVSLGIPILSDVLPTVITLILAYLGFRVGTDRREEIGNLINLRKDNAKTELSSQPKEEMLSQQYKVLDTSVIIDGRIKEVLETGFIEGTLLVTNDVLSELQHIADSADGLKRERGRRGLDILNDLQSHPDYNVEIYQDNQEDELEVDQKLVNVAKKLNGVLVTTDYNLNKVAKFQNVRVLNVNDLANSVKPIVIAGEKLTVTIVKEGTEREQGVAYLSDGTMVIVEEGKNYMHESMDTVVTSTIQTSAGRMIFTKPTDEWLEARNS